MSYTKFAAPKQSPSVDKTPQRVQESQDEVTPNRKNEKKSSLKPKGSFEMSPRQEMLNSSNLLVETNKARDVVKDYSDKPLPVPVKIQEKAMSQPMDQNFASRSGAFVKE
jgi:hypothetical protein